jgi:hypothetical protein
LRHFEGQFGIRPALETPALETPALETPALETPQTNVANVTVGAKS